MKYLVSVLAILFLFFSSPVSAFERPKLYVREGCSHCAKVEAFMKTNSISDKVETIETLNNEETTNELDAWFKKFNVDPAQQGVPFMVVDEETYFGGDVPIIEYLGETYGIDTTTTTEYQDSTADKVILYIGGGFLFAILGYGVYSMFSKKD